MDKILDLSNVHYRGGFKRPPLSYVKGWKEGLYDHQKEAVVQVLVNGSGILKLATGTGKSWIIGELCRKIRQYKHILVVTSKIDLLNQIRDTLVGHLDGTNLIVDVVGDGNKSDIHADITVGLVGTLNKINGLDIVGYVIYDECHKYINQSGIDLYNRLVNVELITALSATPYTEDPTTNDLTTKLYGPLLYELTEKDAIDLGCISTPKITMYNTSPAYCNPKFLGCKFSNFAYNQQINSLIINNKGRNNLIVSLVRPDKSTVIIVNKVNTVKHNHAVILKDLIEATYPHKEVYIVKGGDTKGITHLTKSNCIVIAGPNILTEGSDIPHLEVVVLAGTNSSATLLLQRVGRVLRRSFTKQYGEVIDFLDPKGWPSSQSKNRLNVYKSIYGEHNITIV